MKRKIFTLAAMLVFTTSFFAQIHHLPLTTDANDIIGSLNGTLNGDVTFVADAERGNVATFDGDGDWIDIPAFISGKTEFSVAVWYKQNFVKEWRCVLTLGNSDIDHIRFMPDNGCCARTEIIYRNDANGNTDDKMWPGAFQGHVSGDWYHAVITFTGTTITGYENGVKIFEGNTIKNPMTLSDVSNFIGKNFYGDFFNGSVSDFRIYDTALSDAEVASLYVETEQATGEIVGGFAINSITQKTANIDVVLNAPGKVYFTMRAEGDAAPDVTTVINEANAYNLLINVDAANTITSFPVTEAMGGQPKTRYVFYFVAEDGSGTAQSAATPIAFKTLANTTDEYNWPLQSDVVEANGSGLDGTVEGATFETDAVRGDVALLKDGYITIPSFINNIDELSMGIWFRMDEERLWSKIYSFGEGPRVGDDGYRDGFWLTPRADFDVNHPFSLEMVGKDAQWTKTLEYPTIGLGEWHHFMVVITADNITEYLDGAELSSMVPAKKLCDVSDVNNYLGKSYWADALFGGAVSDLWAFTRAFTAQEVLDHYNGTGTRVQDEVMNSSAKVYPNPATDNLFITADEFSTVEIFNSLGQSVLRLKGGRTLNVNTSGLNSGLYLIRFSNNGASVTKQLIIK
jgi:hypothetical protein